MLAPTCVSIRVLRYKLHIGTDLMIVGWFLRSIRFRRYLRIKTCIVIVKILDVLTKKRRMNCDFDSRLASQTALAAVLQNQGYVFRFCQVLSYFAIRNDGVTTIISSSF